MDPGSLLVWYNLVYVIPFGFSMLFLVMQLVGLDYEFGHDADVPSIEADADLDVHADVDLDAHADVDLDVHADVDADVDSDVSVDTDLDAHVDADAAVAETDVAHLDTPADLGFAWQAALLLGVGRVPISALGMCFGVSWFVFGVSLNALLQPMIGSPLVFFPLSFAGALTLSFTSTALLARGAARLFPKVSTFGSNRRELAGSVGRLLYGLGPGATGTVRVRDSHGNLLQFPVFTAAGQALPSDAPVLLLRFDERRGAFEVEAAPPELTGGETTTRR